MADVKELIKVEREQNGIATVTFNRPKSMNSLSKEMIIYLAGIFMSLSEDANVGIIILTGAGKAFCAGVVCLLVYFLPLSLFKNVNHGFILLLGLYVDRSWVDVHMSFHPIAMWISGELDKKILSRCPLVSSPFTRS